MLPVILFLNMEKAYRKFLPPNTFLFFLCLFLISLIFLSFFRLAFLLRYLKHLSGIPIVVLLKSFLIGARYDTIVLSYLLMPFFFLASLPYIGFHTGRLSRAIFYTIMFIVFSALFFLSLVDIEFYGEFGSRLNLFFIEYLDKFGIVVDMILEAYPVIPYLIMFLAIVALFIFLVLRTSRWVFGVEEGKRIFGRIIFSLLGLVLLVVGARGRVGLAPMDWGTAYFSHYDFANQLALNGVYTLGWSIYTEKGERDPDWLAKFEFYPLSEALMKTQKMVALPTDSFISPDRTLARYSKPGASLPTKPNIVIILLESWQAKFVGAYGCTLGITPNFDSLAQQGIFFENMYATGIRTNRGLVSTICSFPSQPGLTIMKKLTDYRPFISLPKLLSQRGYRSIMLYGGDLKFDNMDGFMRSEGIEEFVGQSDFPRSQYLGKWGVPDHILFDRANEEFLKFGSTPFLGIIITLSNHPPNLVPDSSFMKFSPRVKNYKELNSFYYSDFALGRFFRIAKNEPYFNNTIFVLVADHGRIQEGKHEMVPERFKIAGLIYAPGFKTIIPPRRIKKVVSQVDILPTIMGLLGETYLHESWGRDALSTDSLDSGFAIMIDGMNLGYLRPPYYYVERVGVKSFLYDISSDPDLLRNISSLEPEIFSRMESEAHAYLEASVLETKQRRR